MTQDYVDQNNKLHQLDDVAFEHLLPAGCTRITPEQAADIRAAQQPPFDLAAYKVDGQNRIDAYYEELYKGSVANSAIGAEYDAAYMVAKKWVADFALDAAAPVPERILALAETYGVTNAQAAGVVITKWTEGQAIAFDQRGAARLRAKYAVRQAVDKAGVDAAETAGRAGMLAVTYSVE